MASTDIIALRIYAEPKDALVYINGTLCNVYCCTKGEIVEWSVSKEGYTPQSGTLEMNEDKTLNINLEPVPVEYVRVTIYPTPSDALVVMNGIEGAEQYFVKGTEVTYTVSKEGYQTATNTIIADSNQSWFVRLVKIVEYATLKINASPDGCTVSMNGTEGAEQTFEKGTEVAWKVENLPEYITKEGSLELNEDTEFDITLERLYKFTAKVELEPLD